MEDITLAILISILSLIVVYLSDSLIIVVTKLNEAFNEEDELWESYRKIDPSDPKNKDELIRIGEEIDNCHKRIRKIYKTFITPPPTIGPDLASIALIIDFTAIGLISKSSKIFLSENPFLRESTDFVFAIILLIDIAILIITLIMRHRYNPNVITSTGSFQSIVSIYNTGFFIGLICLGTNYFIIISSIS